MGKSKKKPSISANTPKSRTSTNVGGEGRDIKPGLSSSPISRNGDTLSLPPPPPQLDDVSPILFETTSAFSNKSLSRQLPYIGPIKLVRGGSDKRAAPDIDGSEAVVHGRGLVASRDLYPGECLFVTPAIFSTPVGDARDRFHGGGNGTRLEQITEELLVEKIHASSVDTQHSSRILLDAFLAQMSSDEVPLFPCTTPERGEDVNSVQREHENSKLIDILTANPSASSCTIRSPGSNYQIGKDRILSIIRRNAFGPDYHNYDKIALCWSSSKSNENEFYNRLLGVYPLAAMINHSCSPNAVRVFSSFQGNEVMIVHANAIIPKGTEITWSYLPPSTDFFTRQKILKEKYSFDCLCTRCMKEKDATSSVFYQYWLENWSNRDENQAMGEQIEKLEHLMSNNSVSNEVQRYLRVGLATSYMKYFNEALAPTATMSCDNARNDVRRQVLQLSTQLHFSFLSCNNASTEHISILHLCYELASALHADAMKNQPDETTKTLSQVRFWTDQLKKAHMVRYGYLGRDIECVRAVMKHTKLVLRNRGGWFVAENKFI
ncbi:hypothetical protein ACHAXS_005487 [Conticribra weissflogii]